MTDLVLARRALPGSREEGRRGGDAILSSSVSSEGSSATATRTLRDPVVSAAVPCFASL